MAKKPNCRRTDSEKRTHDRAVRMRNMTDEQLVGAFDKIGNDCYGDGLRDGKNSAPTVREIGDAILKRLDGQRGIGAATLDKIRAAIEAEREKWEGTGDDRNAADAP